MAIKDRNLRRPVQLEIDLASPQGNALCLIGTARSLAKQLGKDADAIAQDMMSGDYDHLIEVFDSHFGQFVTLYR